MVGVKRYSPGLIQHTKEVFDSQLGRTLTDEEAEDIIYRWSALLKLIGDNLPENELHLGPSIDCRLSR